MFSAQIAQDIKKTANSLGFPIKDVDISIPENSNFGDYSTNIALKLNSDSPQELAYKIIEQFGHPDYLERVEVAGPGFINFFIKDSELIKILDHQPKTKNALKRIIVEYADPNTHKDFHIGHVRPLVYGESVARLLEYQGVEVYRSNYGSDIGPTVAKTLWGIGTMPDEFEKIRQSGSLREKAAFLGKAYTLGHKDYEDSETAKIAIDNITKKLYERDEQFTPIWNETKDWSLGYFDTIYNKFSVEFDTRINESEVEEEGKKIVEDYIGKIFEKNDGAVIFPGEKYGLHTRVFITSAGNPTYEAKELGLTRKYEDIFPFDELIILSDSSQTDFFRVVIKAMELIDARFIGKKRHLSFGSINLTTGKMSSRLGNIISAEEMIEKTAAELEKEHGSADPKVVIGAIKLAILKYGPSSDIQYDPKTSVSLQGDSGPYLQYTFARTESVKEKAGKVKEIARKEEPLVPEEREVLKQLEYSESIFDKAAKELEPSQIAYYLLNLTKSYNNFYQRCPIIKSEKEVLRLSINKKTGEILKNGLYLLGIDAPNKI